MTILALLLSFIPEILVFFYLRNNRKEQEYRAACGKVLWRGIVCAVAVALADLVLSLAWSLTGLGERHWLIDLTFRTFVLFAGVEETVKFIVAKRSLKSELASVSKLDIIAFMAIAAMGFGMNEDVIYAFNTNIGQIIVRGVLMGHVGYGLLMGLLYARGLERNSRFCKVLALLIPIFLHGLYDFSLNEKLPDFFAFVAVNSALLLAIFIIYMLFFIRKKRKDPAFTEPRFTLRTEVPEVTAEDDVTDQ